MDILIGLSVAPQNVILLKHYKIVIKSAIHELSTAQPSQTSLNLRFGLINRAHRMTFITMTLLLGVVFIIDAPIVKCS